MQEGIFWLVETPDRRVAGTLVIEADDSPKLETFQPLFAQRQHKASRTDGGMVVGLSGDPEDLVADFQPRTIHGELCDGTAVSIVNAQGGTRRYSLLESPLEAGQEFHAGTGYAIIGELVTAEHRFCAIRFQVLGPRWYEAEDEARTTDGGQLRMYRGDDSKRWFEFIGASPQTFHALDVGVLNAVTTLTGLATRNDAIDANIRVQLEPDSPWRVVHRGRAAMEAAGRGLLDTTHLTAATFARWVDFRTHTAGLDAAVLDELEGAAVQTQVLALVAVAEGLHRRLFGEKEARVKGLTDNKIAKMRRAARKAALALMSDPPFTDDNVREFGVAIGEAFAHINDQTFRSRMADLLNDAQRSIPDIGSAFADWPDAVSTARNVLVHQPTLPNKAASDQFLDLLIALSYSISWVLRTNLLNEAGVERQILQQAYRYSSAYGHHLANTRALLSGGRYAATP